MAANFVTGLDIGTFSIKTAVLEHNGRGAKLISFGSIPSPQPGISSESDMDLEATAKSIRSLVEATKAPTSEVMVSLPESKIFTRVISDLPYLADDELSSAIKYSAEEFVPLPSDQVNLYWQVIDRSKQRNNTSVFVVASPKNTVKKYIRVLEMAGLRPMALETDMIAATRALVGNNPFAPTTLIVQLGASSTDYAVVSKGIIMLTRSIATGGNALTRAISQYLNFEVMQAEEYKKVYGLQQDQLGGKIYQVLQPLVDLMVSEAGRVLQSFQNKNPQNIVKRIVLTGGGAKMPGIVIYFANQLGMETQEADPWAFVEKNSDLQGKLAASGAYYSIAVGLALRNE